MITAGAVMIDFAGPWELFQDVMIPRKGASRELLPSNRELYFPIATSDTNSRER